MARYTGRRLGNSENLEYGLSRSNNARHKVMFQAMEYHAPTMLATGDATQPTNDSRNMVVPRPPMYNSQGSVSLYLPAQINLSQKSNYGEPEMGAGVAGIVNAAQSFTGANMDSAKAVLGSVAKSVGAGAGKGLATLVDQVVTGGKAGMEIASGVTRNNSTELMFEGVDRRNFSFSFRMIPHNADEAKAIQAIVKYFRFHMAPHVPDVKQYGQSLAAPSVFNITYPEKDDKLHKIFHSVLESIDVKYGGERPQFYHDDRPTETEITLQFKEQNILTKRLIAEGY